MGEPHSHGHGDQKSPAPSRRVAPIPEAVCIEDREETDHEQHNVRYEQPPQKTGAHKQIEEVIHATPSRNCSQKTRNGKRPEEDPSRAAAAHRPLAGAGQNRRHSGEKQRIAPPRRRGRRAAQGAFRISGRHVGHLSPPCGGTLLDRPCQGYRPFLTISRAQRPNAGREHYAGFPMSPH